MSLADSATPLTANNTAEFWTGAWANGTTGWKTYEKDRVVFTKNIRSLEETLETRASHTNGQISVFSDHRGAFVPLCGDTYAVRFLTDGFAACSIPKTVVGEPEATAPTAALRQVSAEASDETERALFAALTAASAAGDHSNHRFVMGVDIAPEGIARNMADNFPEFTFASLPVTAPGIAAHYFARAVCPAKFAAYAAAGASKEAADAMSFVDVHLFVGDYFAVTDWWSAQAATASSSASPCAFPFFDFSYDRASMMAMHPSLHQRYVDGVKKVFGCGPDVAEADIALRARRRNAPKVFLELAHREEGKRDVGPPFHIEPSTVAAAAGEAEEASANTFYGKPFRIVPLTFDDETNGNAVVRFNKFGLFLH